MAEQKLVSEPWGFPDWITIDKSASHQLSQNEIASDNPGDLNGSTQHSARTHIALKTRAKSAG